MEYVPICCTPSMGLQNLVIFPSTALCLPEPVSLRCLCLPSASFRMHQFNDDYLLTRYVTKNRKLLLGRAKSMKECGEKLYETEEPVYAMPPSSDLVR